MDKKARIAHFLAQGFKPAQIASIVGVSPAYISQLGKDPSFSHLFAEEQTKILESTDLEEEERLNNKYLAAEHLLLDNLTGNAALMDPRDQIKALEVVASRQEKRQDRIARLRLPTQSSVINNIVQIGIPGHALPEYHVNTDGEIVSIGNRLMAPMSSDGVKNLFTQMKDSVKMLPIEL